MTYLGLIFWTTLYFGLVSLYVVTLGRSLAHVLMSSTYMLVSACCSDCFYTRSWQLNKETKETSEVSKNFVDKRQRYFGILHRAAYTGSQRRHFFRNAYRRRHVRGVLQQWHIVNVDVFLFI